MQTYLFATALNLHFHNHGEHLQISNRGGEISLAGSEWFIN